MQFYVQFQFSKGKLEKNCQNNARSKIYRKKPVPHVVDLFPGGRNGKRYGKRLNIAVIVVNATKKYNFNE
jgi:hypothetical protein